MGSCVSTLRRIQDDVGISDEELKRAVHNIATPTIIDIKDVSTVYGHEKERKEEKRRKKLEKKVSKKRKYKVVYWYLEEYLRPEFARKYYTRNKTVASVIEDAYRDAIGTIQVLTLPYEIVDDPAEIFGPDPIDEYDIPDEHWEAFGKWIKKHPLKKGEGIIGRRKRFMKSLRKVKRKYYSKKNLRQMYDPLFVHTVTDEKEMLENLKRISAENELRIQEFHKMLDSLCKDNGIKQSVMKKFRQQTDDMIKHHKRRIKEFVKRTGCDKPTPIMYSMDDDPIIIYDDWSNPDSIDSIVKIPYREFEDHF